MGAQTVQPYSSSPTLLSDAALPRGPGSFFQQLYERLTRHAVHPEGPDAAVAHGSGEVGSQGRRSDGASLPDSGEPLCPDGRGHLSILIGVTRFWLAQVSRCRSS